MNDMYWTYAPVVQREDRLKGLPLPISPPSPWVSNNTAHLKKTTALSRSLVCWLWCFSLLDAAGNCEETEEAWGVGWEVRGAGGGC